MHFPPLQESNKKWLQFETLAIAKALKGKKIKIIMFTIFYLSAVYISI